MAWVPKGGANGTALLERVSTLLSRGSPPPLASGPGTHLGARHVVRDLLCGVFFLVPFCA